MPRYVYSVCYQIYRDWLYIDKNMIKHDELCTRFPDLIAFNSFKHI